MNCLFTFVLPRVIYFAKNLIRGRRVVSARFFSDREGHTAMAAKKRTAATKTAAAKPKTKKVVTKKAATTKAAKPKVAKAAKTAKAAKPAKTAQPKAAKAAKAAKPKKAAMKLTDAQIDLLKKVHALSEYTGDSKERPKLKALVTKKLLKTKADKVKKTTIYMVTVSGVKHLAKAAAPAS